MTVGDLIRALKPYNKMKPIHVGKDSVSNFGEVEHVEVFEFVDEKGKTIKAVRLWP